MLKHGFTAKRRNIWEKIKYLKISQIFTANIMLQIV